MTLFHELTALELWLASGRFLLMVSGVLLGVKHLVWWARHNGPATPRLSQLRHFVEMVSGFVIGNVYALQIFTEPQASALSQTETVVVVWTFAALLSILVVSRVDNI